MDSRTTAIADRDVLPLTPRKQESSRVVREVLSRQKFCFRRASKRRVLDRSADPHRRIHQRRDAVLHTDLTGDSTDADCTMRSVAKKTSQEGYDESPRRADPDKSATSATRTQQRQQQCSVTYKLTGRVREVARHPPHRSRSRRSAGRHTALTVKRRPPYTSDSNHLHENANRARKSWRSDVSIILPGWERHTGGSRSIPTVTSVRTSVWRLWVAQTADTSRAQT